MFSTQRSTLPSKVTFQGAQSWKESIAAFCALLLLGAVLISICVVGLYALRDGALVEEVFDYVDKTVAISKINYNHALGFFKPNSTELQTLASHKSMRTMLSCYLFSDVASLLFIVFTLLLFFTSDVSEGRMRVIYWVIFALGALYCIITAHLLFFLLLQYSTSLPTASSSLLDRAIPHNPGGLQQMETRFGCSFNLDLYASFRRKANPTNTCDPYMESSFISPALLVFLLCLHLIPFVVFVLLVLKRTPLSECVAQLMEKRRSLTRSPVQRQNTYHAEFGKAVAVNGAKETFPIHAKVPPPPSPAIDHSISYNNAAYLATSALNSSRSSELSRIEDIDLFKGATHHQSGSIMSNV